MSKADLHTMQGDGILYFNNLKNEKTVQRLMHEILSCYGAFMNSYQALAKDVEKSF